LLAARPAPTIVRPARETSGQTPAGKFGRAVDSVAKKRGLLFVVNQDSGVLAWADPKLDITPDVIAIVNQP
jgi:Skp family chaperone for outer membrane proteins